MESFRAGDKVILNTDYGYSKFFLSEFGGLVLTVDGVDCGANKVYLKELHGRMQEGREYLPFEGLELYEKAPLRIVEKKGKVVSSLDYSYKNNLNCIEAKVVELVTYHKSRFGKCDLQEAIECLKQLIKN